MNRRLYFLSPDCAHARATANDLVESGVPPDHIHTITNQANSTLPPATPQQREDLAGRLERWSWNINLGLFGLAAIAGITALFNGAWVWAALAAIVMLATFVAGERFTHLPNAHLDQFRDALRHGEILLLVDIPQERVADVERQVTRRHPEAVPGGASWQTDALAL